MPGLTRITRFTDGGAGKENKEEEEGFGYLFNNLGQGQCRAVLLTATGSDSKSDLLSPHLFEKIRIWDAEFTPMASGSE